MPNRFAVCAMSTVTRREALLLAAVATAIVPATLMFMGVWPHAAVHFGDNDAFVTVADALLHRDFTDLSPHQFWGTAYVVAVISVLTPLDAIHALWLCSWLTAFATIWLAADLWGGTVAAWIGIASFPWLQRAALGGSEPLFMCLLLSAFALGRRERFLSAMGAAILATMVRPIGAVAVAAIIVALARRRDWRSLLSALGIAAIGAVAYGVPLWLVYGDPFANVRGYRDADWAGQLLPISLPLLPLVRGWMLDPPAPANAVKTVAWLGIVLSGLGALLRRGRARELWESHPIEAAFAAGGLLFVLCYNAPFWAPKEFARFVVPITPFVWRGLEPWLSTRRVVLWPVAIICGVLAASSLF